MKIILTPIDFFRVTLWMNPPRRREVVDAHVFLLHVAKPATPAES